MSIFSKFFLVQSFLKEVHLLGKTCLQSLLFLGDTEKFISLKSEDFVGDFGLVNERSLKNFELKEVGKSRYIRPPKIRLRFDCINKKLWTKIRKSWKWTFFLTFSYSLSDFCP